VFKNLKIKSFTELRRIKSKKCDTCTLLGSSPSAIKFNLDKNKSDLMVFGDIALRLRKIKPDYWVARNQIFPVPGINFHANILNEFKKMVFIYSNIQIKKGFFKNFKKNLLKIRYFQYNDSDPKNKHSLEFNIKKYLGEDTGFIIDGTVFLNALAIAMSLGYKKIYIYGVDLPMKNKNYEYVKSNIADDLREKTFIYYDYQKLKEKFSFRIMFLVIIKIFFPYFHKKIKNFFFKKTEFNAGRKRLEEKIKKLFLIAKMNNIKISYKGNSKIIKKNLL
jgi:hypothetical protein